jgi:uncharacterized protein (TIGR03067 family)
MKKIAPSLSVVLFVIVMAVVRYQGHEREAPKYSQPPKMEDVMVNISKKMEREARDMQIADEKRIVGHWVLVNDDSGRYGKDWEFKSYPNVQGGLVAMNLDLKGLNQKHSYRLNAAMNPKQIDIRILRPRLEIVGTLLGIYTLDDSELRICFGEMVKPAEWRIVGLNDRGTFPKEPKPGQVLILKKSKSEVKEVTTK